MESTPSQGLFYEHLNQKLGSIWLPAGTFESSDRGFEVSDVTIRGAGMWYSRIHGLYARFNTYSCAYILGDSPCSGKSTVVEMLSAQYGFHY